MYQIIESVTDKNSPHFGKEFVIYECEDSAEAENGTATWSRLSAPGASYRFEFASLSS